jgi:hypothetical protein
MVSHDTFLRITKTLISYRGIEGFADLADTLLSELVEIPAEHLEEAMAYLKDQQIIIDPLVFRMAMAIAGQKEKPAESAELADPDDAESSGPFHFDNNPKWIGRKVVRRNNDILVIHAVDTDWSGEDDSEQICLRDGAWCHKDGRYYYNAGDHEWDIVRLLAKGA